MKKFLSKFFSVVIKVISGYYLFSAIFLLIYKFASPSYETRLYIKETFHLDPNNIKRLRIISQISFGLCALIILSFVLLYNFAPFGMKLSYAIADETENISVPGPKDRVVKIKIDDGEGYKQIGDLIYFTSKMPFHFDTATVTITYQNPYPDQELSVGFKNSEDWHYDTQIFDSPIINTLSWEKIGTSPTLFQREKKFANVADFLQSPPKDGIIGTYNFDVSTLPSFKTVIPDYQPKKGETVIDTPLRGKHVMYTYLKGEPFMLKVTKQDLNWYKGEDTVAVKIYKDGDLVYEEGVLDDGVTDASKQTVAPQEVEIKNPGPELPESGVYKIVFEASSDTVIKKIVTNLHKIVFEGPLFPVNNSTVYPGITASTSATTLYTNAVAITARTYHPQAIQTIQVDGAALPIRVPQLQEQLTTPNNFTMLTIPENDVVVSGLLGYFSMSQDQFFNPSPHYVINITKPEDLTLVDYVLTDYTPSHQENGWTVATQTFDLSKAVTDKDKLSWLIKAPGLKKNNRSIIIKDIQVTLSKKPMIKM